jgi:hypothetical protein
MLLKRIEKLEAHLPMSPGRLLERLDRQALSSLSGSDRELVNQMLNVSGRRKTWPAEYCAAETRYLENFEVLLREITDEELNSLIAQFDRQLGHPLSEIEATA